MPVSCGWHPWFRRISGARPRRAELEFEAEAMYRPRTTRASRPAPWCRLPRRPWDDCFTDTEIARPPRCAGRAPSSSSIESRGSDFVVFTEPEHAICVEPQTGPPDALNLDPAIAAPGDPEVATATFAWRVL